MSANDLDGEVVPGCPRLVSDIILSTSDLVVNTTARDEGTVVVASCRTGFQLQGEPFLTCHRGSWSHPTPSCVESAVIPSPEPERYTLPERDIIIIAVCCGVVLLILIGLIICIILYRKLQRPSHRKTTIPGLRSTRTPYPPYSFNWYLQNGLHTAPSVASAPPSGYPLVLPTREKSAYRDYNFDDPVYSVMWDANKMDWHDSFDYTRSRSIPRPKLSSGEQWAFPYNYTG